jgi:NAD(P)H-dependent flavin oxidoreductase YrpB (nitropropane dioxygenase family)
LPICDLVLIICIRAAHPIINAAGSELAAAVSNAGGMGVIGGVGYTPKMLRETIHDLKAGLRDPNLPWGVDLLLPQVGGSARKTNKDYTKGSLMELIDIVIEEKATLFVSAVGVPPKEVVDKLHKAGILVANMVGHEKHAIKAMAAGADIIIAQGGEGALRK